MDAVVEAGDAMAPQPFATNSMQIAVPPDNPAGITTLDQLVDDDVKVALCQPQVPCGEVAAEVLDNAGLTVEPVTEEVDVKSVLTKVRLGEVDAGMVYVTDVVSADDEVRGVEIPADVNASTTYPIATLERSEHPDAAEEFVDLVLSEVGTKVLEQAGFELP
jgi:molybdate transport system substrate-binding protein